MRRIFSLAALAALLTATSAAAKVPAARPAPASSGASLDLKDLSVGGYIGGEFGDVDLFALRADASLPLMPLTPKVKLLGVASLGFGHGGMDLPFGGSVKWNLVTVVPAARAQLHAAPKLDLYGDAGLGLYFGFSKETIKTPAILFVPATTVTSSGSSVGLMMRFAVGGLYEVSPELKVGAELGLTPYFSDVNTTDFVALVGAQYKL